MMYHQMPYAPVYYPPQMYYGDYPARVSLTHGQWPPLDDGSRGYMAPPVHCHGHGCCNYSYLPGPFAVRPPCPYHHHVSPLPSFYPSCYPATRGMYPPAPTPYYPPYEYNKDMSMGGCDNFCGWFPDHPSSGKQEKHARIEEEEPEMEKKNSGSLVPFEAKNYPYPVVWLQPNDMFNNRENKKSDDSRYKGRDKILGAQAGENPISFSQQPILWNGWFPYDMSRVQSSNQKEEQKNNIQQQEEGAKSHQPNMWTWFPFDLSNLETMKHGEEQGSNKHQKDDDKKRNFPFPVFLMPYKPSMKDREEEPEMTTERDISKKTTSNQGEVPSHIINFQPEKLADNKEKPERHIASEGNPNLSKTNSVVKTIPVKQLKPEVDWDMKTSSKNEDERKKKPLEECENKESTSPRKTSTLPPVCLRVEPLPKRKGSNGKSRSPSPPGNKRQSDDASGKQAEIVVSRNLQNSDRPDDKPEAAATDRSKEEEKMSKSTATQVAEVAEQADRFKGEVKLALSSDDTVRHVDAKRKNAEESNECNEDRAADSDAVWKESGDVEAKVMKTDAQSVTTKGTSDKAEESKKVKLSDAEAATVIQAAYRGFEVRKWGTLKKLKKLAEVKEQVAEIKTRIQALESSCDVGNYDKQKSIVSEMIMGLLLKLDTVQGLHTSIRDVRKSIAKELVSLQEALDALLIKGICSDPQLEQPSGISSEGCMPNLKNEDISVEWPREENGVEVHDLSKIDQKVSPPVELCDKQVHDTDPLPKPELEKSETIVTSEGLDDKMRNVPVCTSTEHFPGASDSAAIVGGSEREHNDFQSPIAGSSSDDDELELRHLFEGQDRSREMSNFDYVSKEMSKKTSDVLPLAVNDNGLYSGDISDDDPKKLETSGDSVETITDIDEAIISNPEQVALEESREGSEECKEEEKIIDGTFLVRPHAVNGKSEKYVVDIPTEVPKESTEFAAACEVDEITPTEIPRASEKAGDTWEPDETVSQDLAGLGWQVDELPGGQKEHMVEKGLIELSHLVHDAVQFEQGELQKEDHRWERDTGYDPESGCETAVAQQECPSPVPSVGHEALQVETEREVRGEGVDSLCEAVCYNDDKGVLSPNPEEEVADGLRKECGHLANEENTIIEELQENDYGFVSGGSDVFPYVSGEKSEEMDNTANEMENISPIVIPPGKMDATCLAPEDSEGMRHVTCGNNEADELDLSLPSPTASQASLESRETDRKLMEENEKLRDMMKKLLKAGNKQLSTISELSGRINDLEKRLARKKKKQLKFRRRAKELPLC